MHVLDNPIWRALTTRQSDMAIRGGVAARFHAEINLLAGFEGDAAGGSSALRELVARGEQVGVFLAEACATPGFAPRAIAPLVQMIHDGARPEDDDARAPLIAELGATNAQEMFALAELTKPGPFRSRTPEMGDFAGVRVGGELVAMAGQRLRVPGHVEISAICTHPDHVGRGYGAALTRWQLRRILDRGERAFLHVRGDNARAIALYERLGFEARWRGLYTILEAV